MEFLGNKDVNEKLLQSLNDEDLANFCHSGVGKEICSDESFWMRRTIKRFSEVFTLERLKKFKEESNLTWRNYYISLINFMESSYETLKGSARKDLRELSKYMFEKTNRLLADFDWNDANSLDRFLKEDFINPNQIFIDIFDNYSEVDADVAKEILMRLTESGDPRLRQKSVDNFRDYVREEGGSDIDLLDYIMPLTDKKNKVLNEIKMLLDTNKYSNDILNKVLNLLK